MGRSSYAVTIPGTTCAGFHAPATTLPKRGVCWRWRRFGDGSSRTMATKIGGVGLQIVRAWVLRFNARGPDGLIDRKAPGKTSLLSAAQRAALHQAVEAGPKPYLDGVMRWRLLDLAQWLREEFGVWRGSAWASTNSAASVRELGFFIPLELENIPRRISRPEGQMPLRPLLKAPRKPREMRDGGILATAP